MSVQNLRKIKVGYGAPINCMSFLSSCFLINVQPLWQHKVHSQIIIVFISNTGSFIKIVWFPKQPIFNLPYSRGEFSSRTFILYILKLNSRLLSPWLQDSPLIHTETQGSLITLALAIQSQVQIKPEFLTGHVYSNKKTECHLNEE